ncbi:MAG: hypothetical protein IJ686_02565 [Bacteroidales bacterium]|nr:hypothetical protein [Bacteroidales bacterium]
MELAAFVNEHLNDDLSRLILQRDKWPQFDMALAADCIAARRKLRGKVPEWYDDPRLLFPSPLSAEQCSSSATARFKAQLAMRAGRLRRPDEREPLRIADLTGGLGVDSWQFATSGARVLYNEMNAMLAEAAAGNFSLLGLAAPEESGAGSGSGLRPSSLPLQATGPSRSHCRERHASPAPGSSGAAGGSIECSCSEITPESLPALLERFRPDIVYMDPARRSSTGDKVFRLKDCSPDVLRLQDIILGGVPGSGNEPAPLLLLKLSPMADISQICRELHNVREVHCVEYSGECKELLVLCEAGFIGEPDIFADVLEDASGKAEGSPAIAFRISEETSASARLLSWGSPQELIGKALFEPGPALRKAGAFKLLSSRFNFSALGPDAHFYLAGNSPESDARSFEEVRTKSAGLGRWWRIADAAEFGKSALRDFACKYPECSDFIARGLPIRSEGLASAFAAAARKARAKKAVAKTGRSATKIFAVESFNREILLYCINENQSE